MTRVIVLRGCSGSGKSTWARAQIKALPAGKRGGICSADNYFLDDDGNYNFDYKKLDEAHRDCFAKFCAKVDMKYDLIIIDNTNTKLHEMSPYIMYAKVNMLPGDTIEIKRFECSVSLAADRNVHGVPRGSIENQKKRMERVPQHWVEEDLIYTSKG